MTARRFPDNQEVDQWISARILDEADAAANPVVDQLQAATVDAVNRFQAAAPGMVASGLGQWAALDIPDRDRTKIRGAVRQVIAAESAGLMPLCRHVNLLRPLVLICDPPILVCADACPAGAVSSRRSATSGTTNATGAVCTCRC